MADVTYVPGTLTAVTGDHCWVLVDATPDSPAVGWLWQQLGQRAIPESLLAGLLGARFAGATDFALLIMGEDDRYRLFCRGAVTATADVARPGSGGRVEGGGLLTWREHAVPGDWSRIVLGSPADDDALRLPATAGVLLAGCVIVEPAASGTLQRPVLLADAADRREVPLAPAMASRPGPALPPEPAPPPAPARRPEPAWRPEAVPHPDTVASSPRADGQPEPAGYPDTITMTGTNGWSVPDGARPSGRLDAGPVDARPPHREPLYGGAGPAVAAAAGAAPAGAAPAGAPPAGPPSGGADEEYDFLWGATQMRSVTDAAIRQAAEGEADGPLAFGGPGLVAGAAEPPAFPQPAAGSPPVPAMPGQSPRPAAPRGPDPGPGAPGGLIDAPSWSLGPGPAPEVPEETEFTAKRGVLPGLARGAAPPPDKIGPAVPALICPAGHANPPSEAVCRSCRAPLPADPVVVPRPVLGVLRLSVGDVIALDRGVVMGRAPRADAAGPAGSGGSPGEERPHVVKLPSADGDVSRTHVRVSLDGWHVLVTDLNSTNGTLVTLPGREPQQLRPGEPMPIKPGTVVTLADGIDFRYEVSE